MAALTLLEAAKAMQGQTVRQAVVETFARSHPLLEVLPFTSIAGNAHAYRQESALPGIAFRSVNASWTSAAGVMNPEVEKLVIAGGTIEVDRFVTTTEGEARRTEQERMKIKSLAHTVAHKFIKGDSSATASEFDGMQRRLAIGGAQVTEAGSTDGGDALSLYKMDTFIKTVDDPTHLYMSKAMATRFSQAARTSTIGGYITFSLDEFGRQVMSYNGLPIIEADANAAANASLAFDEVGVGGATATATSIYCLSLREGMCTGLQNSAGMIVEDLGYTQSPVLQTTLVEWYVSIGLWHPRAAARLRGIKDTAIVA